VRGVVVSVLVCSVVLVVCLCVCDMSLITPETGRRSGLATPSRPRARSRRSAAKWTTPILRSVTTTSTIKRRCAVSRSRSVFMCAGVGGVFSVGVSCVRVTC